MAEEIKTTLTADASQLAAEFAKASAIAQKYAADRESQGNRALASARSEVESLRLEASGHGAAAAALREKMQLTEQARRLSAQAGISEENATSILARQLELRKQMVTATAAAAVAQQRAARLAAPGSNGISLPQMALNTANLSAMEKGAARAKELRRQYENAGRGGRNGALGVLAFSQALEDSQYGIRGVLNNIPQMVMNFGGGAGLAGAISMAAVAGVVLYPVLARLYGAADNDVLKKAREEWGKIFAEGLKAAGEIERTAARTRDLEDWTKRVNQSLAMELGIHDQLLASMEREIGIREKARSLATEQRTAEEALAAARGQTTDPSAGRKEELKRIEEDIRAQRDLSERAQAESARLNDVRKNNSSRFSHDGTAKNSQLEEMRRNIAGAEANIKKYQTALEESKKAGTYTYNDQQNVNNATAARDALKAKIADIESARDAAKAAAEKADSKSAETIAQMDEKANKAYQEAEALKALLEQRKQLLAIEEATRKATREKAAKDWSTELSIQRSLAANDVERARALERQRDIEAEKRHIMAEQKGISEKQAGKMATDLVDTRANAAAAAARKNSAEEMEILRARAAGENDRAGKLRSAATLEREILNIMREQNLTRERAERMARERQEMERNKPRGDILAEMKALKMEAGGDKKGADRLREEMRIREESVALAERLGVTETQAQSMLREKARLQKQIADLANRHRGRIYKKTDEDERLTQRYGVHGLDGARGLGGAHGLGGPRGLRDHELHRRTNERIHRPQKPGDDAAKNLLKSVNIQQEMLKIWQKLNVV